jgi:hypothetical protein
MYAVECTTDGGNSWTAMRVNVHTAINLNEFVMQFLPDFQTSIRITECDCETYSKCLSEEEACVWIVETLAIKVFYTLSGKENIFHFSFRQHAEEVAALLREYEQGRRYDVVMVRC